uniref:Uncharacterized protein n=1 Tax=Panagrolaimus superbus TaxID=310955 RepID=A0A914YYQ3_9BILA
MQLQHQHQQQQLPQTIPEKEESEAEAESEASSIIAESPVPKYKPSKTSSKRRHSNHLRTFEPSVLDRVFEDVASIVNSHISRTESSASLDNEFGANTRWRQMYESVYSELEKLRNLLMIQHRICERQKKEVFLF